MSADKFNYWFFKKAIPSKICDDIIRLGLNKKPKLATTIGFQGVKKINKNTKVLFENKMKSGNKFFGRDEHFNSVIVDSNDDLTGKIKNVKILKGNQNTLFGEGTNKTEQKVA